MLKTSSGLPVKVEGGVVHVQIGIAWKKIGRVSGSSVSGWRWADGERINCHGFKTPEAAAKSLAESWERTNRTPAPSDEELAEEYAASVYDRLRNRGEGVFEASDARGTAKRGYLAGLKAGREQR